MIGLPSEWFDENPRGGATVNANHPPAGAPVLPLLVSSRGFRRVGFSVPSSGFDGRLFCELVETAKSLALGGFDGRLFCG